MTRGERHRASIEVLDSPLESPILRWREISIPERRATVEQRFEHCRLAGTRVTYLGRDGLFEDRKDRRAGEFRVWDYLEKEGWELVSVVADEEGQHVFYFKRPIAHGT